MYTLQLPGTNGWDATTVPDECVREDTYAPLYGQTATGYGAKMPTRTMLYVEGRWRRVYVACYGNASSAYVMVKGERAYVEHY